MKRIVFFVFFLLAGATTALADGSGPIDITVNNTLNVNSSAVQQQFQGGGGSAGGGTIKSKGLIAGPVYPQSGLTDTLQPLYTREEWKPWFGRPVFYSEQLDPWELIRDLIQNEGNLQCEGRGFYIAENSAPLWTLQQKPVGVNPLWVCQYEAPENSDLEETVRRLASYGKALTGARSQYVEWLHDLSSRNKQRTFGVSASASAIPDGVAVGGGLGAQFGSQQSRAFRVWYIKARFYPGLPSYSAASPAGQPSQPAQTPAPEPEKKQVPLLKFQPGRYDLPSDDPMVRAYEDWLRKNWPVFQTERQKVVFVGADEKRAEAAMYALGQRLAASGVPEQELLSTLRFKAEDLGLETAHPELLVGVKKM